MVNPLSPGIYTSEINYTTRATSVVTAAGAIAGVFKDGPVDTPVLITSRPELIRKFGKPTANNYETWYTAADFLEYSSALYVNRVVGPTQLNAAISGNPGTYLSAEDALANTTIGVVVARSPGDIGNSLKISICPNANSFSGADKDIKGISIKDGANSGTVTDYAKLAVGDILQVQGPRGKYYDLLVTNISSSNSKVRFATPYNGGGDIVATLASPAVENTVLGEGTRKWGYYKNFGAAPTTGLFHMVVVDENGEYNHTPGTVVEKYTNVSPVDGSKRADGSINYYKTLINGSKDHPNRRSSDYIYATGATVSLTGSAVYAPLVTGSDDGVTERNVPLRELKAGYDVYADKNTYDIRYILQGKGRGATVTDPETDIESFDPTVLARYIIGICETRKDCMAFITPTTDSVAKPYNTLTASEAIASLKAFRNKLGSTSYAFLDSGYKLREGFDESNYWTPLNGDIAGLVARTAVDKDPWYSPAGYARGKIKNVLKLAFNPNEAHRDAIYPFEINPVITQPGEGTLLFGDKTLLGDDSAFDNINVRMLFITIEKAIEKASKASLFEFNDAFTRSQFKNIVEPYLRDVQGRRGIYDFKVVCDETNNTPEVIDSNTFIGDIYIKPARSINFIKLNFVAVKTGTSFNEVVGQY